MVAQSSRLPPDKLENLFRQVWSPHSARKLTLKNLQQLVGHLNFACCIVAPGQAFLQCLCDSMAGLRLSHHWVQVSAGMRADLLVWLQFLQDFNGISFWRTDLLLEAELQICSTLLAPVVSVYISVAIGVWRFGPGNGLIQVYVKILPF